MFNKGRVRQVSLGGGNVWKGKIPFSGARRKGLSGKISSQHRVSPCGCV